MLSINSGVYILANTTLITMLLMVPLIAGVITSLASELVAQAEDVSNKTIDYTQQMNDALDCAFKGIPIRVCSPDLANVDFDEDIKDFNNALEKVQKEMNMTLQELRDTALGQTY